ncbi:YopX family protein [Sporosarcina sp. FSL K6-1508]|uniref:YopX family protein n=1 Tax=Sporosarcina sp. FSL K6-1508 TaxID=2921553 RepID=UPI0030F65356
MRELKFRVWTGEEMIFNETGLVGGNGFLEFIVFHTGYQDSDEWKTYKFMQYTGLKDKNGREIYEGDILDYKWKVSTRDLLIVEWSERDACFLMGGVRTDYAIAYGEVIGNIHENPELLGDTK